MKLYTVFDSRRVRRYIDMSLMRGAFYTQELYKIRDEAKKSLYVYVAEEGFGFGVDPRPYFYVYSVSGVDPLSWILERFPTFGVNLLTFEKTYDVEECRPRAVFHFQGGRWVPVRPTHCYKLVFSRPEEVAYNREYVLSDEALRDGIYATGFNIKYAVRVTWDRFRGVLGYEPLWVNPSTIDKLKPLGYKVFVFDIEVVNKETYIVSVLRHVVGEEPRIDDVETIVCRAGRECDELLKLFRGARVVYGHNIVGFDIPHLLRNWAIPELILSSKLDGVKILSSHGQSFQIGASKSLYAVARRLRRAAGITDEELRVKEESDRILSSGDIARIIRYNRNDVILTAKIGNVLLPFIYMTAALIGAPLDTVQELPAGVLAEYLLYRILEYRGVLIGYKRSSARMEGSKVLLPCAARQGFKSLLDYLLENVERGV